MYCNQRDEGQVTVAKSVPSSCMVWCSAETSVILQVPVHKKKMHCICSNDKTLSHNTHKHTTIRIC